MQFKIYDSYDINNLKWQTECVEYGFVSLNTVIVHQQKLKLRNF